MNSPGTAFKRKIQDCYRDHFAKTKATLPNWLCAERERAFDVFCTQDLPTRKNEAWKYTSLSALDMLSIKTIQKKIPSLEAIPKTLPRGVSIRFLSDTWDVPLVKETILRKEQDIFTLLNTSFLSDGCFVSVAPGVVIEKPLVLLCATTRVIIEIGQGATMTLVAQDRVQNDQTIFTNSVTEILLHPDATLNYYKIQELNSADSVYISRTLVSQKKDSRFLSFVETRGAQLVRNDLDVALQEKGSSAHLLGLYTVREKAHVDNHISINHLSSYTKSKTAYHGILEDEARAVFNGKISVGRNLKGVNAVLNNHNLLLSSDAEIDTKPELEIYSDDVKCTHGATVGQIDEEALFYLESRGIPKTDARNMLKEAFMGQIKQYYEHSI